MIKGERPWATGSGAPVARRPPRSRSTQSPRRSSACCRRTVAGRTRTSPPSWASPGARCASGSSTSTTPASSRSPPSPTRSSSASPARPCSASPSRAHRKPVAEALAAIQEIVYVVITAGGFDMLAEVVGRERRPPARAGHRAHPADPRGRSRSTPSSTSSWRSRPTPGACASRLLSRAHSALLDLDLLVGVPPADDLLVELARRWCAAPRR